MVSGVSTLYGRERPRSARDDVETGDPKMTVERERLTNAAIAHDDERCGVAERQLRVGIAQELAPGGAPLLGVYAVIA
jgi:hypothetical protein